MRNNCNELEVQDISDLPVDNIETLPQYIIAERDVMDETTGSMKRSFTRVPSGRLFPSVQMDNVFSLDPNNPDIEIPENQVRAVRIVNEVSEVVMRYADETHAPMMLALGKVADMALCQNSGVIRIPEGHSYIIGQQYLAGENGEPVTSGDGAKLFIPISETKLLVNM